MTKSVLVLAVMAPVSFGTQCKLLTTKLFYTRCGICRRFVRNQVIFANTLFRAVCYRPDECQLITGGTDRKVNVYIQCIVIIYNHQIGYWETHDGSQIRELDGSKTGSINGMDITPDGIHFITGGDDRTVKVIIIHTNVMTIDLSPSTVMAIQ